MKKNFMLKKILLASSCLSLLAPATAIISSCSDEVISKINLYPDEDEIRPGRTIVIRAVVEPSGRRTTDLNWSIVSAPFANITISNKGYLTVPWNITVNEIGIIVIEAVAPNDETVRARSQIYLLPVSSDDFGGFKDNKIYHVDRSHKQVSTDIIYRGNGQYETSSNIDLFEWDDEIPEGWTSLIKFEPIINSRELQEMKFELEGGEFVEHAIAWDGLYNDGEYVTEIPSFITFDSTKLFDTIKVHFACDEHVCLTIHFNTWQRPSDQSNTGSVAFYPDAQHDPHYITEMGDGEFQFPVFCPISGGSDIISYHVSSLYFFKKIYEYTELDFEFVYSKDTPQELLDAFRIDFFKTSIYERKLDHFKTYKVDFWYYVDMSKVGDALRWLYNEYTFVRVVAFDPVVREEGFPDSTACWCDLVLRWV